MSYLTPAEFAALIPDIGVKDKVLWVKRRCRAKQITCTRPSRNVILIPAGELDRWLARHTIEAVEPVHHQPEPEPAQQESIIDIAGSVRSRRRVRSA